MKKQRTTLLAFLLGVLLVVAMGARTQRDSGVVLSRHTLECDTLVVDTAATFTTALTVPTATIPTATITTANIATENTTTSVVVTATITTANIATAATTNTTVATAFTNSGIAVSPFDAVSLTSPTSTFTATTKKNVTLTTDAAITTITITSAVIGQEIIIHGTSDSNTAHFDDASSFTLNGDMTLGIGDTLSLICTNAAGDEWRELGRSNN